MNPHNLLTASISLAGTAYKDPSRQTVFFQSVLRQLAGLPEVQSAAVTSDLPYTFPGYAHIALEGRPAPKTEKQALSAYFAVSPGYLAATGIPLHEGREFTLADNAGSVPVAIVNEAFAQKFFPNENPWDATSGSVRRQSSGERLRRLPRSGARSSVWSATWTSLWGSKHRGLKFLNPFLQRPDGSMCVIVRLRTEPGAFADLAAARRREGRQRPTGDQP